MAIHRIVDVKNNRNGRPVSILVELFTGTESATLWTVRELLTRDGSNPKLAKNSDANWRSTVLHLAPHKLSGLGNTCPMARTCIASCLNTAGRGRFSATQLSRIARTAVFYLARDEFKLMLSRELERFAARCHRDWVGAAARLNGTSDIRWHRIMPEIFDESFPIDQFYDYTKDAHRYSDTFEVCKNLNRYHLTFSYDGTNWESADQLMRLQGVNCAAVFRTKEMVSRVLETGWRGRPVINGDLTDQRFLDPDNGAIVALYAKGKARHDNSAFIVDVE